VAHSSSTRRGFAPERTIDELLEIARALEPPAQHERKDVLQSEAAILLDGLITEAGRGSGAIDVAMGEALAALAGRVEHLGFVSIGDYAVEVLGVAASTAAKMERRARYLRDRPLLRAAVWLGEVDASKADAVMPVALNDKRKQLDEVLGRTASIFRMLGLWREAKFASFAHYCAERPRTSVRAIEQRIALERKLYALPLRRCRRGVRRRQRSPRRLRRCPRGPTSTSACPRVCASCSRRRFEQCGGSPAGSCHRESASGALPCTSPRRGGRRSGSGARRGPGCGHATAISARSAAAAARRPTCTTSFRGRGVEPTTRRTSSACAQRTTCASCTWGCSAFTARRPIGSCGNLGNGPECSSGREVRNR
jgi:hypothetical protein